jgi:hypothetical protein
VSSPASRSASASTPAGVDPVAAEVERLEVVPRAQRLGDRPGAVGAEAVGAQQQVPHQRRVGRGGHDAGGLHGADALLAQVEPAVRLYRAARELLGCDDGVRHREADQQRVEVARVGETGVGVGDGRAAHRRRVGHQGTLR